MDGDVPPTREEKSGQGLAHFLRIQGSRLQRWLVSFGAGLMMFQIIAPSPGWKSVSHKLLNGTR